MRRRLRLIPTFLAGCLALVMLGFGVYALTTPITYDISGNISYTVTDTYVEVNAKIYKSDTYLTKGELADTVEKISNLSFADIEAETNLEHISYLDDTYSSVEDFSGNAEYADGEGLSFNFATSGDNTAFAYFIVMNIANLTQNEDVYAVMQDDITDGENTFQYNNALQENILNGEDNRNMVVGIIVEDITTPIEDTSFNYGINISTGDVARSEQMTSKYYVDEDDGTYYLNDDVSGVLVLDPSYDGVDTTTEDGGLAYQSYSAIYIRDGIETIELSSFYSNSNLKKIVVPASATSIDGWQMDGDPLYTLIVTQSESENNYTSRNEEGEELNCIIDIKDEDSKILVQGCNNTNMEALPENITKIGYGAFNSCYELKSIVIPDTLSTIEDCAFQYCENIKQDLVIPASVTSIGEYTFQDCYELTSITIEDGQNDLEISDGAFNNCNKVNSLYLPQRLTSLGEGVFTGCGSLNEIVVNEENANYTSQINGEETNCLIEIGEDEEENTTYTILRGCNTSQILDGVTSIGSLAFNGCTSLTNITIPDSVTSIGSEAFYGCTSLASITIPDSVTSIGNSAFSYCSALKSVMIEEGENNLEIGSSAFYYCTSLTSIIITDSVTSIGNNAFNSCTGLKEVTLGNGITSLESSAFYNCTNVTKLNYNSNITTDYTSSNSPFKNFGSSEGLEVVIGVDGHDIEISLPNYIFYGNTKIKSVDIQDNVTSIGEYSLQNCSNMEELTIGNGMTHIHPNAFNGCTSITKLNYNANINFDNKLGSNNNSPFRISFGSSEGVDVVIGVDGYDNDIIVGDYMFYCNDNIKTVVLKNNVVSIGDSTFSACTNIESIIIPDSVLTIGQSAFRSWTSDQKIYIYGDNLTLSDIDMYDSEAKIYINDVLQN